MIHIAIFASGTGSNARKIVEHFSHRDDIAVNLIVTNKKDAKVLELAQDYDGMCSFVLDKDYFYNSRDLINVLQQEEVDYIVLAGFLWLLPPHLIKKYPNRILNIHPALLPKFGGKGMYGILVHKAVKEAHEKESGPTIHLVNEEYDKGEILFQASVDVGLTDSIEDIAAKVLKLEHKHYAPVIEKYILSQTMES
jgi:phosphoribosylglycinamide formyltransferase-1